MRVGIFPGKYRSKLFNNRLRNPNQVKMDVASEMVVRSMNWVSKNY